MVIWRQNFSRHIVLPSLSYSSSKSFKHISRKSQQNILKPKNSHLLIYYAFAFTMEPKDAWKTGKTSSISFFVNYCQKYTPTDCFFGDFACSERSGMLYPLPKDFIICGRLFYSRYHLKNPCEWKNLSWHAWTGTKVYFSYRHNYGLRWL